MSASAPALPRVTSPSKLVLPATLRRPPEPMPPVTINAPVLVDVLAVLSVTVTAVENVFAPVIVCEPVVSTNEPVAPTSGMV